MRVLICPDKFKDCLSAPDVATAMRRGVSRAGDPEITTLPVSDGGEGFTQAIAHANDATIETLRTFSATTSVIDAPYCLFEDNGVRTAAFTVADIIGREHVPRLRRNPAKLRTDGVGMMLRQLADEEFAPEGRPPARVLVGLGGSTTVDGGVGMGYVQGWRILDRHGRQVLTDFDRTLARIETIEHVDGDHPLKNVDVLAVHDVDNPLTGPNGAARVFGPQKGATKGQVERLDAGLANLHQRCIDAGLCHEKDHPGDGSAGGLGFGLRVFANAALTPGAAFMIDALNLRERIGNADLVVTGEGRLDAQSMSGKAAWAIGRLASELGVPCVCVAGSLGEGWEAASEAFTRTVAATPEGTDESEGIARAEELIGEAVFALPELSIPR